jgi:hypothetical protein
VDQITPQEMIPDAEFEALFSDDALLKWRPMLGQGQQPPVLQVYLRHRLGRPLLSIPYHFNLQYFNDPDYRV